MRLFFNEGEILVAEVQMLYHDGAFGIHTRNLKYGKLVTGELIVVRSGLVKRSRSHFHQFEWGVEVILGLNGYIWVGKPRKPFNLQDLDSIYSSQLDTSLTLSDRQAIARTRNCIVALDRCFKYISGESVTNAYRASLKFSIKDILLYNNMNYICGRE
jgi:exosome complex component RRP4